MDTSKTPNFVAILRCSKNLMRAAIAWLACENLFTYIFNICDVHKFYLRLVSLRTLNF